MRLNVATSRSAWIRTLPFRTLPTPLLKTTVQPSSVIWGTLYSGLETLAIWKHEEIVLSSSVFSFKFAWPSFSITWPLAAMKCWLAKEPGDGSTMWP